MDPREPIQPEPILGLDLLPEHQARYEKIRRKKQEQFNAGTPSHSKLFVPKIISLGHISEYRDWLKYELGSDSS